MGTPAHVKNCRNRPMSAIAITAEEFVGWIYHTTRDPQKFPKQYRGDIINQLRNTSLVMTKHIYRGLNVKCKTQHDLQKIRKIQDMIFDDLTDLQALLMVVESLRSEGFTISMERCATLYTAVVDDFDRWVKNTKRKLKRANDTIAEAEYLKSFGNVKRDKDGFIILKRR